MLGVLWTMLVPYLVVFLLPEQMKLILPVQESHVCRRYHNVHTNTTATCGELQYCSTSQATEAYLILLPVSSCNFL